MKSNKTPVLFLIFNRADTTEKVFDAIKKHRPAKLFIAADGPRGNKLGEKEKCEEVRKITENIDWPCKVKRLYRNKNLGCKKAVSSAIDWFFENVKEGIILEDDCLPNPTFFKFCELMLEKYRRNKRIMHIGGDNFQPKRDQFKNGYYFSKYPHVWGWATWRRAWKYYDVKMESWPKVKKIGTLKMFWSSFWERHYWTAIFDLTCLGKIDTWDYQWLFTTWVNNALSIIPGVNLVENIGFGDGATHVKDENELFRIKAKKMQFPPRYPERVIVSTEFDKYTSINIFRHDPLTVVALKMRSFRENIL